MSEPVIAPYRSNPLVMSNGTPSPITSEFLEQVARLLEQLQIASGSGSPEGVLTAGLEKLYRDTGTNTLYIKTTETGNTGWVAV
jgi:hypothetical protein